MPLPESEVVAGPDTPAAADGNIYNIDDPDLFKKAACIGVGEGIMDGETNADTAKAKEFCGTCVIKEACLEYALVNKIDHGVWGGTSRKERNKIRRARSLQQRNQLDID